MKHPTIKLVGNIRSKELHVASCPWVKLMSKKNRRFFPSFSKAHREKFDSCGHCLPNDLYKYVLALENFQEQAVQQSPSPHQFLPKFDYFQSRIYNNSIRKQYTHRPTFSVLNYNKMFGVSEAHDQIVRGDAKFLFIVLSGQQSFIGGTSSKSDEIYCRDLTGGDRVLSPGKILWSGGFDIHTSKTCPSVASRLFDRFGDRSLIVDVLNTKYDWEKTEKNKQRVFDHFYHDLHPIFDAARENGKIRLFICGFSRGGVLALRLAEALQRDSIAVEAVVTIDPVINPYSSDFEMVDVVAVRNKEGWTTMVAVENEPPPSLSFTDFFPVLKPVPGVQHYNVFQRRSLKEGDMLAKPVGSAVSGALSPYSLDWSGMTPAAKLSPYDQYDTSVSRHTPEMLRRYGPWINAVFEERISSQSFHV